MARHQPPWLNWSQYLAFRLAVMGLHMFDVDLNLRTAGLIGSLLHRSNRKRRMRAAENVRLSFPHWPAGLVDEVAEQSMQHLLRLGVEVTFTTRLIQQDSWADRITLGPGIDRALALMLSDRPAIMVTGHYGNWELLGYLLAMLGVPIQAIARPIDNPLVNRWLLDVRQKRGMRIITKWGATEKMVSVLQGGGTLAFIADQNAGDKGLFAPFFGRMASTYKSIGLLAIQQNCPVICGYAIRRGGRFHYEIGVNDIIEPADWQAQPDPLYYLTARYTRAIEKMILLAPEQYLWVHRRFKSRPRYELEGRPMPAATIRKLQALPWMDDAQLERLTGHPVKPE